MLYSSRRFVLGSLAAGLLLFREMLISILGAAQASR